MIGSDALVGFVLAIATASLQLSLDRGHSPFLTAPQITARIGDDSDTRTIVAEALRYRHRLSPQTTTVLEAQVRDEWLPDVPGIQFTRLADTEARTHYQQCGRLLYIDAIARPSRDIITTTVAEGNRCQVAGSQLRFHRTARGWQVERSAEFLRSPARSCDCP